VLGNVLEKEPTGGALAHQPPEKVGERHHDGVDVTRLDECRECRPVECLA